MKVVYGYGGSDWKRRIRGVPKTSSDGTEGWTCIPEEGAVWERRYWWPLDRSRSWLAEKIEPPQRWTEE